MLMRVIFGQKEKLIMKGNKILVNMTIILRYIRTTWEKSVRIAIILTVRNHLKIHWENHVIEVKI